MTAAYPRSSGEGRALDTLIVKPLATSTTIDKTGYESEASGSGGDASESSTVCGATPLVVAGIIGMISIALGIGAMSGTFTDHQLQSYIATYDGHGDKGIGGWVRVYLALGFDFLNGQDTIVVSPNIIARKRLQLFELAGVMSILALFFFIVATSWVFVTMFCHGVQASGYLPVPALLYVMGTTCSIVYCSAGAAVFEARSSGAIIYAILDALAGLTATCALLMSRRRRTKKLETL